MTLLNAILTTSDIPTHRDKKVLCEVWVNDVVTQLKSIRMFWPICLRTIHLNSREKWRHEYEQDDLLKIVGLWLRMRC